MRRHYVFYNFPCSDEEDQGTEVVDYKSMRRTWRIAFMRKPFNFGSDKRGHTLGCGENSMTTLSQIEDDSSSGENVEIEDKPMPPPAPLPLVNTSHSDQCSCPNCDEIISRFTECGICLEPYQNVGACVCACCGGMWCARCTKRVSRCAWCRSPLRAPAPPCLALKRLINHLRLPCRNYKRGCPEFLTAANRVKHEEDCKFDQIICPINNNCIPIAYEELADHLLSNHKIVAVYSQKIKILIENFQAKLQTTICCKSKYKIVLLHTKSAFIIKVCIYNYHVRVEVMRKKLGYSADLQMKKPNKSDYGAVIEFQGKALSTRLAMMVGNGTYSKKAEVQWNDVLPESGADEEITVHVNIIKTKAGTMD